VSDLDGSDVTPGNAPFSGNLNEDPGDFIPPPFEPRKAVDREGLPPTYRMRADAHYVDQLTARSNDVPLRLLQVEDIDEPETADTLDAAELQPLVQSVAEHGIVQPLLVRREGPRYRLLAGRRRLAAARGASMARVPCMVYQVSDAQADALALAANVRGEAPAAVVPAPTASHVDAALVASVAESVTTIQSSASLLAADGSPMARRIAIGLVRAEAWRAAWQLRAAAILERRHDWRPRSVVLGSVLGRVREEFGPEQRLGNIDLRLNILDWNVSADLDEAALVCGIAGAVFASAGLATGADVPELTLVARRPEGKRIIVEVTQDAAVPDAVAARFFDPTWTDRPGGRVAMLGAAVAKAVAEQHGGTASFVTSQARGGSVKLTLGRSSVSTGH
jgi:hypothetical protein